MTHATTQQKAPRACDSEGLHNDTNSADFRSHRAVNQAHDGKAMAHQLARLALAGHVVHKGKSGDYLVSKYGMARYCADFAELATFAQKLGVK